MSRLLVVSLLSAGVGLSLPMLARADDSDTNFSGRNPSVEEITKALTPKETNREGLRIEVTTRPTASFDQIEFEFDSSSLTPQSEEILKKIGAALTSDRLKGLAYRVEGHTDGVGSDAYNLALSKRRAESVKRYLMSNFDIGANRLQTEGKGMRELLLKDDPENPKNRRVVFVSIIEE